MFSWVFFFCAFLGGGFGGGGFGSPAPAPGGLFGAPAPAPAYGAPAPGGLFGAPPTPGGGMFGAAAPAPLAFGMPAPAPAYGAPQPSLFGAPAQQQMLAAPPVGSVMPPAANEILASQLAALETQRKKIEKSDNFRAKPPQSSAVNAVTLSENEGLSSLTPVRASYPTYRASPRSNAKVRPRGFASPEKATTPSLSRLGTGGKPMAAPDSLAASSVTRLVINPSPKPKMKLLLDASSQSKTADNSPFKPPNWYPSSTPGLTNGHPASAEKATLKTPTVDSRSSQGSPKTPGGSNAAYDYYQQVIGSPDEAAGNASPAKKNAAPKLTKPGYQCTPTIEVLGAMAPEDLAAVPNFSVERPGVGKIEWEGAVDVRGADFDSVIIIEPKSASVYMKEEELDQKPPVGTKLNRSAILTLEGVLPPTDGDAAEEKFARKVEKQTSRMGAELISYDSSLGEWKLRVKHFSRYALSDDDSESEPEVESDFESGERGGRSRVVKKGILKNRLDTPYKPRMNLALDEAEEEEGIPVAVSDVEMTEEFKVLAEAEDVFANMKLTMTNNNVNTSRKVEEDTPFPEEREAEAKPLGGSRYIPSPEDLAAASTMGAICSDIAREAGVKSSSTDFGLRMGRSFRIGWSPNGSFLSLQSGGRLIRRRPTFSEHGAHAVDLLEKHQAHSQKVKVVENCPQFSLPPKSTGNNDLQSALKSYSGVSDESRVNAGGDASISKQAFSLLKCLLDSKEDIGNDHLMVMGNASGNENSEERLVYAVKRWLVDSCSNEVDSEISTAKARNEKYAALLAAVTGGDIEKACTTAQELGHPQLATILASGPDARGDILKEVLAWADSGVSSKIPDELLRIYFLIGGDPKMEEDICRRNYSPFDWRRQLAMRLTYGSANPMQSLDSIIQEYEGNLSRGVAPYPQPLYLSNRSKKEIQCVLYRLLRMKKHEREVSLREVIDPSGITSYVHDFSLSFHLAAAISAMGCSSPLTDVEEQSLVDGYVAQLITQGHWDWAVYASLCLFDTSKANYSEWKRLRAKTLVIQNYWDGLPNAEGCRQLLEGVGVPSEWFEEALALRCSTNGDFYGYLNHMVQVSPETACATLEHILIPNMLFMNKEKLAEAHRLLEVFSGDKSSLASAVFSFFQVYQNILLLEGASRTEIEVAMPALFETCEEVEQVFAAYRLGEEKLQGPPLRLVPHTTSVPMASFLAEALSQISLFKCQLKGLEAGISISNTASQILNLSQPKEFRESGISARENICRWLM